MGINGRPKKVVQPPQKKKIIQKTTPVKFFGVRYIDVTNIYTYSEEWESDQEYNEIRRVLQSMRNKYL